MSIVFILFAKVKYTRNDIGRECGIITTQQESCIRGRKFNGSRDACAVEQVGAEHPDVLPHDHER